MKWLKLHATAVLAVILVCLSAFRFGPYFYSLYKGSSDEPTLEKDSDPFAVSFTKDRTLIKMNDKKFPECQAFKIVFSGAYYGLFMATDYVFLPAMKAQEKEDFEVTCEDSEAHEKFTAKYVLGR